MSLRMVTNCGGSSEAVRRTSSTNSACKASSVTPGFSRARTRSNTKVLLAHPGSSERPMGNRNSWPMLLSGNANDAGRTPTTVRPTPSISICLPMTSGDAAEPPLPEPIAQDHDRRRTRAILCRGEIAAQGGLDADHVQESRGDRGSGDAFRLAAGGERNVSAASISLDLFHQARVGAPVGEIGIGRPGHDRAHGARTR